MKYNYRTVAQDLIKECLSFFSEASITIEAALGLPLLLISIYIAMTPMRVINEERRIQNSMEACAKDIAQSAYIMSVGESLLADDSGTADTVSALTEGTAAGIAMYRILNGIDQNVIERAVFTDETEITPDEDNGDIICLKLRYGMKVPFGVFELSDYNLSSVAYRRAWIGSDGGRGQEIFGSGGDEEDPIVYVGRTSTRYHKDRHCHYLDNVMKTAGIKTIGELRNSSGGKYHACPSCDPSGCAVVYYFEDGTAYHSSAECKAIGAYVRAVHLSTVEHLGPCSYCSGG